MVDVRRTTENSRHSIRFTAIQDYGNNEFALRSADPLLVSLQRVQRITECDVNCLLVSVFEFHIILFVFVFVHSCVLHALLEIGPPRISRVGDTLKTSELVS
jgi:hypothetical protein